jgi:hypothetical protein
MGKDNKNTEVDNTDKKLHISDVSDSCLPKIDRLKLGIKKYGINSDFMRSYHAMRACIIYDKDDEFFDKWSIE